MKRIFIFIVAVAGLVQSANAQDIIMLVNSKLINARDVTVEDGIVSYRDYNEKDGEWYKIDQKTVSHIYFEDGTHMDLRVVGREAIQPGMSYDQIKDFYNPNQYRRESLDPYFPVLNGFASLLIPGLGQGLGGEWGTGFLHFTGSAILGYTAYRTLRITEEASDTPGKRMFKVEYNTATLALLAGYIALDLYSAYNAICIGRVKNMYYQELRNRSAPLSLKVSPYVAPSFNPSSTDLAAGLALRMEF